MYTYPLYVCSILIFDYFYSFVSLHLLAMIYIIYHYMSNQPNSNKIEPDHLKLELN